MSDGSENKKEAEDVPEVNPLDVLRQQLRRTLREWVSEQGGSVPMATVIGFLELTKLELLDEQSSLFKDRAQLVED